MGVYSALEAIKGARVIDADEYGVIFDNGIKLEGEDLENYFNVFGYKEPKEVTELYVVALVDEGNNVVGFPKGGGYSSPSYVRAFESEASAKRSLSRLNFAPENAKVVRITGMEVVE